MSKSIRFPARQRYESMVILENALLIIDCARIALDALGAAAESTRKSIEIFKAVYDEQK